MFLTQAQGKLDGIKVFGCDGLDGLQTKVSDMTMLEGVMMLTPFAVDAPDTKTQTFVDKFTKLHGSAPDQFAADAVIIMMRCALSTKGLSIILPSTAVAAPALASNAASTRRAQSTSVAEGSNAAFTGPTCAG